MDKSTLNNNLIQTSPSKRHYNRTFKYQSIRSRSNKSTTFLCNADMMSDICYTKQCLAILVCFSITT